MELTLDQALQKGIEAHRSGKLQEADQYYTAILKNSPKHPDANHNLGVLAVSFGKVEKALPFFKTALEINQKMAQYWLSYIDALIKLGRLEDAKAVFDQAINNGAKGEGFDQLAEQLAAIGKDQEPNQEEIQSLIDLYSQGLYQDVFNEATKLIIKFPNSVNLYNIIGSVNKQLGKLEEAIDVYKKAIDIKPDYAELHYNIGNALKDQGKLDEAIEAFTKAVSIKPNYTLAYNNMSNVLKEQGKLEEAIEVYNKALSITPDNPETTANLATLLFESRKFEKAAELFSMNDSIRNQNYILKCHYELNDKSKFYDQLDYLIKRGENNCVIGSYACRAAVRYGMDRRNPFCNDPLKYVTKIDLTNKCDFKKTFVDNAVNVLRNDVVNHKTQGLLKNGIQTSGNIFKQVGSVTNFWQEIIRAELTNYKDHFSDINEGLIQNWPTDYSLYGWLISMKSGGELSAHIHDEGWVSGSIYINVPPKSKKDSGNFVVTTEDSRNGKRNTKNTKSIDVVTGSLCLFPSSLLHYTIPFKSNEDRIVLAFDVIPNK